MFLNSQVIFMGILANSSQFSWLQDVVQGQISKNFMKIMVFNFNKFSSQNFVKIQ